MSGVTFGELGRIVGSEFGPPWGCDLCMATGFTADPCPYHGQKTWDEWITEAFKQCLDLAPAREEDRLMSEDSAHVREVVDDTDELTRLRLAMRKLNRLRSNVIATQNASWSNQMYPLVAILHEAGYEVQGATAAQMEEHLACYGGAGRTPSLLDETPFEGSSPAMQVLAGSVMIHAERWRQQHEEGFTADHDVVEHPNGELKDAAVCYAIAANGPGAKAADVWPWTHDWWKPTVDPVQNLVKAGALIAAEIDRILAARAGAADV